MRRTLVWLWLMTKRLYKSPVFIVSLVLIVVLVGVYGAASNEDSGMMTVALAREDDDCAAVSVIGELTGEDSLIRFVECATPEEAEGMVRSGKADSAWVMRENTEERIYDFVARPSKKNSFIRIIERESNIPLLLAREKLSGVVFKYCSPVLYLSYIRENVPELANLSDGELMRFYDEKSIDFELFEFDYIEGGGEGAMDSADYLTAPLRGLLGIIAVITALATSMYYIRDCERGTFDLIPESRRPVAELGCQLVTSLNVTAVSAVSLGLSGLGAGLMRELLLVPIMSLAVSLFAMCVRLLARGLRAVSALIPILAVVMLAVCPVFFDLGALRELQYLFPPTYYINGAYSVRYLLLAIAYTAVLGGVYLIIGNTAGKRR